METTKEVLHVSIPAHFLPAYCISEAMERGLRGKWLINVWGGLGDIVCAEPTIRYMLRHFKGEFTLATRAPELFAHLKFKEVFDTRISKPNYDKYFSFHSMKKPDDLFFWFASHSLMSAIDFTSICMARMVLPNAWKEIQLPIFQPVHPGVSEVIAGGMKYVVIHPGKTWPSRTFPKAWWDAVIAELRTRGFTPVIIGKTVKQSLGTVDVETAHCMDLRNALSLEDFVALLQNCSLLLTNDSSPIHIAASTPKAFIGYVSTVKHPDFLTHWRGGIYGHRMMNFGLDGPWNYQDYCPVAWDEDAGVSLEHLPKECPIEKILPDPIELAKHYREIALFQKRK